MAVKLAGAQKEMRDGDSAQISLGGKPVFGHWHANPDGTRGGFVEDSATAERTAFVGRDARVLGRACVTDFARICDHAVVSGNAVVGGDASLRGCCSVGGDARISGGSFHSAKIHSTREAAAYRAKNLV
jgi:UDP-3-O-[3-hydroxymyristoyl] glucosamine N-acyltransferase